MAPITEERRQDSVAISRSAAKVITTVVSSVILGIGLVLWNIVLDHVRVSEQLKRLEEFGPKTGERFTLDDGRELKADIDELKRWLLELQKSVNTHHAKGEHSFAGRRLNSLEAWRHKHEDEHHE